MGDCPFKPYIDCYFSERCPQNKPVNCTYDNLFLQPNNQVLDKDTSENNYRIKPIEQVIYELNTRDGWIYNENGTHRSFSKLRKGRRIEPYTFASIAGNIYQVRGSEFGINSHLGRLISKMTFPVEFIDELRESGLLIDALMTRQHADDYIHNQSLRRLGLEPMKREEYCQKEVFSHLGRVVLMGHIDVALRMGNTLVLIDVKRAAQPKKEHKKQLLAYALGINRGVKKFEDFVLVNILHVNKIGSRQMNPRYDMMYVDPKNSRMIPQLIEEAEESFEIQRELLNDPELMRRYWEIERKYIYEGVIPYIEYLFDHIGERDNFLDPKFKRGLEIAT